MENNLENAVELGTEVVENTVETGTGMKVVSCVIAGAAGFLVGYVFVKCVAIPLVHKIKDGRKKKEIVLDQEVFEG